MAENHQSIRIPGNVVLRCKRTTQKCVDPENGEKISGNKLALHDLSLARPVPDDGFGVSVECHNSRERPIMVAIVDIVGIGERQIAFDAGSTSIAEPNLEQLVSRPHGGGGPQQQSIDEAKHCCVETDSQG